MVEKQSAHRQEIEIVIRGDSRRSWIGLFVGGFLAMTCIVGGLLLASYGGSLQRERPLPQQVSSD